MTEERGALEEESFAVPQTLITWRENVMLGGTQDSQVKKDAEFVEREGEIRLRRLR